MGSIHQLFNFFYKLIIRQRRELQFAAPREEDNVVVRIDINNYEIKYL